MQIVALNEVGSVSSSLTSIILAAVPDMPSSPPVSDPAYTNSQQIKVVITAPASDGGSPIRSYDIQMDDGRGGNFFSLVGETSDYLRLWYTVTSNITKGTLYRFRYRARNDIGWGPYSNYGFILAATVPSPPPAP